MRSKGLCTSLLLALVGGTLISCGGGGDSAKIAQTVDASKNGVIRVELEENSGYAHFKGSLQLNLIGRDSENSAINLNNKATWKLSDKSFGSIKNGLFSASGKAGELSVTVEYAGLSDSQPIIVSDANLVSISINPHSGSVDECKNTSLSASALFDNGLTLEYPLTWAVTQGGSIASFKDPSKGELSTTNSGTLALVARGIDNNELTVSSAPVELTVSDSLQSLTLSSNKSTSMREGETATISVTGSYSDNSTATITSNTSLSASPASSLNIAGTTITAQNGSYAGTAVTLTGSCGGATNNLALTVLKKQINSIEIKNSNGGTNNLSITEGGNLELKITATFADNSTDSDYSYRVNWSIDESKSDDFDDDLITLDQSGKLSVSDDLNLAINQQLTLVIRAEVRDANDQIATNSSGQQLVDEITIIVRP